MPRYRNGQPQLSGDLFLTDAGLETDLIFNHGIEIREFAAHTLLPMPEGRAALTRYFEGFLSWQKDGHRFHPRQRYLESTSALGQFPPC